MGERERGRKKVQSLRTVSETHTFSISTEVSNDENAVSGESNLLLVQLIQASINVYVVQSKRLCSLTICIRGQIENTYTHYDRSFFFFCSSYNISTKQRIKKTSECKAETKKTRQRTQCEEQKKVEKSERSSDHNRFLNAVANQRQFRLFVR